MSRRFLNADGADLVAEDADLREISKKPSKSADKSASSAFHSSLPIAKLSLVAGIFLLFCAGLATQR
ncbi:MAG: hypothetical protein DWQ04_03335 [Chloroflexi bacterium]|nr:MAG: hypothetical protein DWQ04_03335 [Chloroflexota bacterium]